MKNNDALLPCPFCGGTVHVVKAHCADMSDWIQHDTRPVPCGLEGFGNFAEDVDVITLWNTRPQPKADVDQLKDAIITFEKWFHSNDDALKTAPYISYRRIMDAAQGYFGVPEGWGDIDSAPRDGAVIIMAGKTRHAKFEHVGTGHWYKTGKKWVWNEYLGDEPLQPSHWMPLPSAPKKEV